MSDCDYTDKPAVEQTLAEWFAARLALVTRENGYSLTFLPSQIYSDGEPEPKKDPDVPSAVYDDDSGAWEELQDGDVYGVLVFEPEVRLLISGGPSDYKRLARAAWADVTRACRYSASDDLSGEDTLPGVLSVLPSSWSRAPRDGNYCEITISFQVRADGSAYID